MKYTDYELRLIDIMENSECSLDLDIIAASIRENYKIHDCLLHRLINIQYNIKKYILISIYNGSIKFIEPLLYNTNLTYSDTNFMKYLIIINNKKIINNDKVNNNKSIFNISSKVRDNILYCISLGIDLSEYTFGKINGVRSINEISLGILQGVKFTNDEISYNSWKQLNNIRNDNIKKLYYELLSPKFTKTRIGKVIKRLYK